MRCTIVVWRHREYSRVGIASAFGTFRTSRHVRSAVPRRVRRGPQRLAVSPRPQRASELVLALRPSLRLHPAHLVLRLRFNIQSRVDADSVDAGFFVP
jgi:hypothetical protein